MLRAMIDWIIVLILTIRMGFCTPLMRWGIFLTGVGAGILIGRYLL